MKNFDRVADTYDATRAVPGFVPERIADRVVAATRATSETRFLEPGIGTGRIALPLVERGYRYTGVDVSERMMDRLRAKVSGRDVNLTLVNADITQLPFEDASFDVVLGVHIFHLIPAWEAALGEVRRVLAPDGYLVLGYERAAPDGPANEIRRAWFDVVAELGMSMQTRTGHWQAVERVLAQGGAYTAVYRVAHWTEVLRPRTVLDDARNRVFSHTWDVPEDVLVAAHERMVTWAIATYGSLDTDIRSEREFLLSVNRFPAQ